MREWLSKNANELLFVVFSSVLVLLTLLAIYDANSKWNAEQAECEAHNGAYVKARHGYACIHAERYEK